MTDICTCYGLRYLEGVKKRNGPGAQTFFIHIGELQPQRSLLWYFLTKKPRLLEVQRKGLPSFLLAVTEVTGGVRGVLAPLCYPFHIPV